MANSELLSSVLKRQQIQHLLNKLPTPICLSSLIWAGWIYLPSRHFYGSLTTASALQLLVALYLIKSLKKDIPSYLSAAKEIDKKLDTKERLTALISIDNKQENQQLSSLLTQQLEPLLKDVKPAEIAQFSISRQSIIKLVISAVFIFLSVNHALKTSPNSSQITLVNSLLNEHQLPPKLEESLNNLVDTLKHEDLSSDEVTAALHAAEAALSLAESEVFNSSKAAEKYLKETSSKDALDKLTTFKNNPGLQKKELQPTSTPTATPPPQDLNTDETRSKDRNQKNDSKQQDKDVDIQHSKSSQQNGDESGSKGSEGSEKNEPNQQDSSQQSQGENQEQHKQQHQQNDSEGQEQGSKGDSKGNSDQNSQQSSQSNNGSQGSKEGKEGQDGSEQSESEQGESDGGDQGGEKPGGQGDSQGQQQHSTSGSEAGAKSDSANKGSDPALDQVKQSLEAIKDAQNKGQEQNDGQTKDQGKNQGQSPKEQQGSKQQSGKNGSSEGDKKEASDNRTSNDKGSDKKEAGEKGREGKSSSKDGSKKDSPPSNGKDGKDSSQKDDQANEQNDSESEQSSAKKSSPEQEGSGGMALPSEQSETKEGMPEDGDGPAKPQRAPQFKEKQIGESQESYDLSATGSEQGRTLNRNEAEYKMKLKDLNLSKPAERTDSQSQKVPLEYRNWLN